MVTERNRPQASAKSSQEMMGPEAQPDFICFPCPAVPFMFSTVAPAAFFPVFTKALYLLAVFFPNLHMVGICPEAFVSQQGCGLASSFLLLSEWLSCQPDTRGRHVLALALAVGLILHFLPTPAAAALYLSIGLPLAFSCSERQRFVTQVYLGPPAASSGRWFESKAHAVWFQVCSGQWCGFSRSGPPAWGDPLGEGGTSPCPCNREHW